MRQKKYFGTDGIRGKVGKIPISADWFLKLGWSIGMVFSSQGHGKVMIGKDTRISGYMFESALESGLVAAGADVHLSGPMPTPGIAYLTKTLQADVGIVISASHNSYIDNGIKFFSPEGSKLSDEIEHEIESFLNKPMTTVTPDKLGKALRVADAQGRYIEFCKSTFPNGLNLKGIKIVVDCANGASYIIAPSVFQELGAQVKTIGIHPDGLNINKNCGATSPKALSEKVIEEKADLGIALDGDGDRVICVDHTGAIIDGDEILYIISLGYAHNNIDIGGVAGTVMSNLGLELALQKKNIPFCRTKVGDRYIIEALKNRKWLLGGETSGHILCLDAHSTGDGIIAALRLLATMVMLGKTLFELRQQMQKHPQVLINVPIPKIDNINFDSKILRIAIKEAETALNKKGRILLRASGTEPLIRVMVEGLDQILVKKTAEQLAQTVYGVVNK